ncbi:putative thiol peroxidase [Thiosulfatimonas sediminis]|uniref:Putative thiol peroxidase n=1 Tax=Thiosulfatimonas sediminis TaxID=2675054 RepID=A0A6F8PWR1_9GAMM|nr:thiol peroxidase [Thiosulfatimonas sediminis]BBP46583.1 putative thiol peroxidase [Thiosulfatimonas sediminis]
MANITLDGTAIETCGTLPTGKAPEFTLVAEDLSEKTLADYAGKTIVLNIFPSIDTGVCAQSTRTFNAEIEKNADLHVVCISKDLPFALSRFCGAEGLDKVTSLSAFRSTFGHDYGVEITSGPIKGLLSRAIIVINGAGEIIYSEQVADIVQEPNYAAALAALNA